MNLLNNQLTENDSKEFVIGSGYRFKEVEDNEELLGGFKVVALKFSVNRLSEKLNIRLFFDRVVNDPKKSTTVLNCYHQFWRFSKIYFSIEVAKILKILRMPKVPGVLKVVMHFF